MAQRLSSACKVRPYGVDSGSYPVRFDGNSACSLYRGGNLNAALLKQKKSGGAALFYLVSFYFLKQPTAAKSPPAIAPIEVR